MLYKKIFRLPKYRTFEKDYYNRWLKGSILQFSMYSLSLIVMMLLPITWMKIIFWLFISALFYFHLEQDFEMIKILLKQRDK